MSNAHLVLLSGAFLFWTMVVAHACRNLASETIGAIASAFVVFIGTAAGVVVLACSLGGLIAQNL